MNIKMLTSFSSPSKKGPGHHVNWHAGRPQEPSPQVNTVKCREHAGRAQGELLNLQRQVMLCNAEVRLSDNATKGNGDASKLGTSSTENRLSPHILIMFFLP